MRRLRVQFPSEAFINHLLVTTNSKVYKGEFFSNCMESQEKKFIICRSDVYIEPVSDCNMDCKLCYTKKRKGKYRKIIPKEQILDFIDRFADFRFADWSLRRNLERKIKPFWCGTGEIFMHEDFPEVVNELNKKYGQRIRHEIMTNGTIDRLDEFDSLDNIRFYVSIHGPREHNDWIRGEGTYDKSIDFCRKAYELGCEKLEVRTLVTKKNILLLNDFQRDLKQRVGRKVRITLVPPHSAEEIKKADSKLIAKK